MTGWEAIAFYSTALGFSLFAIVLVQILRSGMVVADNL